MSAGYPEWPIGDVLVAPFVPLLLGAATVYLLLLRPLLRRLPVARLFANPPLVGVCLFVILLSVLLATAP
ncbi:MAG: DUF1656 domain-containing protein [Gluconacetobacter diazotrophicus]|nr:DUF1656 domain-containing protein [Gluconacetobacter diazotrophicus]